MLRRLLPRQENFFVLFQQAVDKLVLTSTEFSHLVMNLNNQQHYVDAIARHEQEADDIAHKNFELLHKTFITPFDRHEIHQLTSSLDDIIDLINRLAQRFPFYRLRQLPPEIIQLAQLGTESTLQLKKAIYFLPTLKEAKGILEHCGEIDKLESKAHQLVLAGEEKLFDEDHDYKYFFKLKEIYTSTKLVINRCQDVANQLKGIVLEYS